MNEGIKNLLLKPILSSSYHKAPSTILAPLLLGGG